MIIYNHSQINGISKLITVVHLHILHKLEIILTCNMICTYQILSLIFQTGICENNIIKALILLWNLKGYCLPQS